MRLLLLAAALAGAYAHTAPQRPSLGKPYVPWGQVDASRIRQDEILWDRDGFLAPGARRERVPGQPGGTHPPEALLPPGGTEQPGGRRQPGPVHPR